MKCQRCAKQAILHITEILGDNKYEELHLCEDCAKKHQYEASQPKASSGKYSPSSESESSEEPNAKECEECGIKYVEFRNSGRLGCPHDYDSFKVDLLPLLESIHGAMKHAGKQPRRMPNARSVQAELAALRKKLQKAVDEEAYEEAARLRDQIKQAESA